MVIRMGGKLHIRIFFLTLKIRCNPLPIKINCYFAAKQKKAGL